MNKKMRMLSMTLALVMLIAIFAPTAFAVEQSNSKIETILIEIDSDTVVSVPVADYMKAINSKNALYNYLKGANAQPKLFGISGADKYISTAEFMKALNMNDGVISKAIEGANAVSEETLLKFYIIVGEVIEGEEPVLEPIIEVPVDIEVVEVSPIDPIEVAFGTPINEIELPKIIILVLSNETTEEAEVLGWSNDYDANQAGEYIFKADYELPEGVTGDKPVVEVKVIVLEKVITNIEEVEALIEALPSVEEVTLDNAAEVGEARDAYEALTAEEKAQVSNADKLTALLEKLAVLEAEFEAAEELAEAIAAAEEAIAALPSVEEVAIEDAQAVADAQALVEAVKALDPEAVVEGEELIAELEARIEELIAEEAAKPAITNVDKNVDNNTKEITVTAVLKNIDAEVEVSVELMVVNEEDEEGGLISLDPVVKANEPAVDEEGKLTAKLDVKEIETYGDYVVVITAGELKEEANVTIDFTAEDNAVEAVNNAKTQIALWGALNVPFFENFAKEENIVEYFNEMKDGEPKVYVTIAEIIADLEKVNNAEKAENEKNEAVALLTALKDEENQIKFIALLRTNFEEVDIKDELVAEYQKAIKSLNAENIKTKEDIKEVIVAVHQAIDNVIEAINELPLEITLEDEVAVVAARTQYTDLTEAQQALVSKEVLDKLVAAEAKIVELNTLAAALEAVNNAANADAMKIAITQNAETLVLDIGEDSDYAKLIPGRDRSVSVDLYNNRQYEEDGKYTLERLQAIFNDIVATRLVTQDSMDFVNKAETLEDIGYVTMLLNRFKEANYTQHSSHKISEKIVYLQDLVDRYDALEGEKVTINDEVVDAQKAVLDKIIVERKDGFARSEYTTDALKNALVEVEALIAPQKATEAVHDLFATKVDEETENEVIDKDKLAEGVTQKMINDVADIVNKLADGDVITSLTTLLGIAQDLLEAQVTEAVNALVDENKLVADKAQIDAAAALVEALNDSGTKTNLQESIKAAYINLAVNTGDLDTLQDIIVELEGVNFASLTKAQRAEIVEYIIADETYEDVISEEAFATYVGSMITLYTGNIEEFNDATKVIYTGTAEQKNALITAISKVMFLDDLTQIQKLDLAEAILEAAPEGGYNVKTYAEIRAIVVPYL